MGFCESCRWYVLETDATDPAYGHRLCTNYGDDPCPAEMALDPEGQCGESLTKGQDEDPYMGGGGIVQP